MNKIRYKKNNTSPAKWQVWLTYVGFDGSEGGKKRPVLVTGVAGNSCSIMEISSQPPAYESDIPLIDPYWAGLSKESVIQTRKVSAVRKESLRLYLGDLSEDDRRRMRGLVRGSL